jgi:hypothetical protein
MNARVKRKTVTAAQEAADCNDGWAVVKKLKKRPIFDANGKFEMWIRRVIVDRVDKDLQDQPEAASERNEINEGLRPEHTTAD